MRFLSRRRWIVDILITFTGVVTVALAGLVIEDWLPKAGDASSTDCRVWSLVIAGALLGVLVWLRRKLVNGYGTLYYLRLLATDMADWHAANLSKEQPGYLDQRALTFSYTPPPLDTAVDLTSLVERLARAVQTEMNNDVTETGFAIAPNLVVPAAMAFGGSLYWWPHLKLVELNGNAAASQPKLDTMVWEPSRVVTSGPVSDTKRPGAQVEARCEKPAKASERRLHRHLTADLTMGGGAANVGRFRVEHRFGAWSDKMATAPMPVRAVVEPGSRFRNEVRPSRLQGGSPDVVTTALVDPSTASLRLWAALRREIHAVKDDEFVVFTPRIPKTVAVVLGWLLVNRRCPEPGCKRPACGDPWSRLIVPVYDQGQGGYVWPRVHQSQPAVADIEEVIGKCRS